MYEKSKSERELILEALGEASMCWWSDGTFDSSAVIRIADRLLSELNLNVEKTKSQLKFQLLDAAEKLSSFDEVRVSASQSRDIRNFEYGDYPHPPGLRQYGPSTISLCVEDYEDSGKIF
jgi:hypothetical protein